MRPTEAAMTALAGSGFGGVVADGWFGVRVRA